MCSIGSILFGVSTICQEYILNYKNKASKSHTKEESICMYDYMGIMCWYAAFIAMIKVRFLEREQLAKVPWGNVSVVLILFASAVTIFIFYSVLPKMLQRHGATAATLNILSADFYAAFAGYFIFNLRFNFLYISAMVTICCGILLYTWNSQEKTHEKANESDDEEKLIDSGVLKIVN